MDIFHQPVPGPISLFLSAFRYQRPFSRFLGPLLRRSRGPVKKYRPGVEVDTLKCIFLERPVLYVPHICVIVFISFVQLKKAVKSGEASILFSLRRFIFQILHITQYKSAPR